MVKSIRAGIKGWNIKKKLRQVVQWDEQGAKTSFPTDHKATQAQNRATREDPQVCNSGQKFPLEMQ